MPSSTVSSKGQITVPKEIREALRVGSGDRVLFIVRADDQSKIDAAPGSGAGRSNVFGIA
jgi:AbrB family looped-hinge helix DNA binding protein